METLHVKDLLGFGWATFKKEPWKLIGAFALALVVSAVSSSILGDERGAGGFVLWLIDFVIQMIVSLGMVALILKAHDSVESIALTDAWRPEKLITYAITTILAGIITVVGFILLIVPGIIAAITLMFAVYVVVDTDAGPIEALKKSYALSKGHWWTLFVLLLALIGLNIIGALLLMVGLLVTVPVTMLSVAHTYRILSRKSVEPSAEPQVA